MDAAAVNATRWALFTRLKDSGLPIEAGSGGKTKFNRSLQGYPKAHWIDAACVGQTGEAVILNPNLIPLVARATGHGCRQVTRTDRFGFPRQAAKAGGSAFGFRTGDMVRAVVPKGKHVGVHVGKVAIRATGSFDVLKKIGRAGGISYKHCQIIHRRDGYVYF
jgi:hypothetical protein